MTRNQWGNVEETGIVDELRDGIERVSAIARRRWRTFLAVFVISAMCIQAVAFVWPGTFEAKAAVLMQKTRFSSSVDADPKQPTTVVAGTVTEEEVNSEIAVLTSRQTLEATAKATGLDKIPPPWFIRVIFAPLRGYEWLYSRMHGTPYPTNAQRALAGLADSIAVERLKESNILVVSYRAGDPRFAEIVLNELLKQYLDWHVSVHSQMDVQPFFTTQADLLRTEVAEIQAQLQTLKASLGATDFGVERDIAMRQHASLHEEALLLRRQALELDGKLGSVRASTAGDQNWTRVSTTTKPSTQATEAMRAQVLQLELEQIRLETRFTDSSPLVQENRAKVNAARRALEQERQNVGEEATTGLNPMQTVLQQEAARYAADQAGVISRTKVIDAQIVQSQSRIAQLDDGADEADRLQLQLQSAKDRYLMYLDRTEKARVDAALDRSRVANVSIVQAANAPLKPVRPKRLITLIVSIAGALTIALLVCAWLELMSAGMANVLAAVSPREEPAV